MKEIVNGSGEKIQMSPAAATGNGEGEKKKCKACCACPETRKARDQCIIEKGEPNCESLIEAHKDCMKKMGFNI